MICVSLCAVPFESLESSQIAHWNSFDRRPKEPCHEKILGQRQLRDGSLLYSMCLSISVCFESCFICSESGTKKRAVSVSVQGNSRHFSRSPCDQCGDLHVFWVSPRTHPIVHPRNTFFTKKPRFHPKNPQEPPRNHQPSLALRTQEAPSMAKSVVAGDESWNHGTWWGGIGTYWWLQYREYHLIDLVVILVGYVLDTCWIVLDIFSLDVMLNRCISRDYEMIVFPINWPPKIHKYVWSLKEVTSTVNGVAF